MALTNNCLCLARQCSHPVSGFYSRDYSILTVCLCMTTLTEVFPCFFISCKANARVKPAEMGHGPHSSQLLCYSMYFLCPMYCLFCDVPLLFVCICVLNNCHRVATQLQLNISYLIISRCPIRFSAGYTTNLIEGSRDFPCSLERKARSIPRQSDVVCSRKIRNPEFQRQKYQVQIVFRDNVTESLQLQQDLDPVKLTRPRLHELRKTRATRIAIMETYFVLILGQARQSAYLYHVTRHKNAQTKRLKVH